MKHTSASSGSALVGCVGLLLRLREDALVLRLPRRRRFTFRPRSSVGTMRELPSAICSTEHHYCKTLKKKKQLKDACTLTTVVRTGEGGERARF